MQTKAIKALLRLVLRLISILAGIDKRLCNSLGCAEIPNDFVDRINAVLFDVGIDIVLDLCDNAFLLNVAAHK